MHHSWRASGSVRRPGMSAAGHSWKAVGISVTVERSLPSLRPKGMLGRPGAFWINRLSATAPQVGCDPVEQGNQADDDVIVLSVWIKGRTPSGPCERVFHTNIDRPHADHWGYGRTRPSSALGYEGRYITPQLTQFTVPRSCYAKRSLMCRHLLKSRPTGDFVEEHPAGNTFRLRAVQASGRFDQ